MQILSSAFPYVAAKLADSINTMLNYLAQYTMDLPSRVEQTPA